jgi:tetratricopeptide (TPR) repeat protein
MTAYFRSQRPQQLADLIQRTHDHFHQAGRWGEGAAAALGYACLSCQHTQRAVQYLTEAVALHQRSNPNSGLNDSTLAEYYRNLAHAHSGLGHTKDAVDAAAGAVVCWGTGHNERAGTLETLKTVLRNAKDLDKYVQLLDAEVGQTKKDSPILRKMIGIVYEERKEFAKAIVHLKLAIEMQPNDTEIHEKLMACYDAVKDTDAATKQLLARIDLHRHDLALYQQLALRLKNNEVEAERAATSIIEASPNEAENHAAMAELRQTQNRWAEAIPHWEQVAELRKLEPNGLLKLAEAQLHEKQWDSAKATIKKLRKTEWPPRFNTVENQLKHLETQIPME